METSTLSTKGQLVVPAVCRKALHLQPGDKVAFTLEGDRLILAPTKAASARLVKGPRGRKVLVAPEGAPLMTTDAVKAILADFP